MRSVWLLCHGDRPVAFIDQADLLGEDTFTLCPLDHLTLDGTQGQEVIEAVTDGDKRAVGEFSVDVADIDNSTLTDETNSGDLAALFSKLLEGQSLGVIHLVMVGSSINEAVGLDGAVTVAVSDSCSAHGVLISIGRWCKSAVQLEGFAVLCGVHEFTVIEGF